MRSLRSADQLILVLALVDFRRTFGIVGASVSGSDGSAAFTDNLLRFGFHDRASSFCDERLR